MIIKQIQRILLSITFLLLLSRCSVNTDSKYDLENEDGSITTEADEIEKAEDAGIEKKEDADIEKNLDDDKGTISDAGIKQTEDDGIGTMDDAKIGTIEDAKIETIEDAEIEKAEDAEIETILDAEDSSDQTDADATHRERIWGITIDDPTTQMDDIVDAIGSFKQKMMTRVVCGTSISVAECASYITTIAKVSDILGQISDSSQVRRMSISEYISRTTAYLDQMGDVVTVWEVGSDINGVWLGDAANVVAKIQGAYQTVKARGKKAALSLYYNGTYDDGTATENNCWLRPEEHMMTWARTNIPNDMREGLDYVFVSYYEEDCENIQPDWSTIFEELATLFPNSKLGIGGCGAYDSSSKEAFINRYYRDLKISHSRYIGGYFWWMAKDDVVPKTEPYWQIMQDAMNAREDTEGN